MSDWVHEWWFHICLGAHCYAKSFTHYFTPSSLSQVNLGKVLYQVKNIDNRIIVCPVFIQARNFFIQPENNISIKNLGQATRGPEIEKHIAGVETRGHCYYCYQKHSLFFHSYSHAWDFFTTAIRSFYFCFHSVSHAWELAFQK